jgi:hypothetical protein
MVYASRLKTDTGAKIVASTNRWYNTHPMSMEADRWSQLTHPQGAFFDAQIGAAKHLVLNQVAQEAGLVPQTALRFSFAVDSVVSPMAAVLWPNPYNPTGMCMLAANQLPGGIASFAQIAETPEGHKIEGIVMSPSGKRHGRQLVKSTDLESTEPALPISAQLGMGFVAAGLQAGKAPKTEAVEPLSLDTKANHSLYGARLAEVIKGSQVVGVDSFTVGRLARSLGSLTANVLTGHTGMLHEQAQFTDTLHSLAEAVLLVTTQRILQGQGDPEDIVLGHETHPIGAAFSSEEDGMIVLHRTPDFHNAIALAASKPPEGVAADASAYVDRYTIGVGGTVVQMLTMPAASFSRAALVHASMHGIDVPRESPELPLVQLDTAGRADLERKLLRILAARTAKYNPTSKPD